MRVKRIPIIAILISLITMMFNSYAFSMDYSGTSQVLERTDQNAIPISGYGNEANDYFTSFDLFQTIDPTAYGAPANSPFQSMEVSIFDQSGSTQIKYLGTTKDIVTQPDGKQYVHFNYLVNDFSSFKSNYLYQVRIRMQFTVLTDPPTNSTTGWKQYTDATGAFYFEPVTPNTNTANQDKAAPSLSLDYDAENIVVNNYPTSIQGSHNYYFVTLRKPNYIRLQSILPDAPSGKLVIKVYDKTGSVIYNSTKSVNGSISGTTVDLQIPYSSSFGDSFLIYISSIGGSTNRYDSYSVMLRKSYPLYFMYKEPFKAAKLTLDPEVQTTAQSLNTTAQSMGILAAGDAFIDYSPNVTYYTNGVVNPSNLFYRTPNNNTLVLSSGGNYASRIAGTDYGVALIGRPPKPVVGDPVTPPGPINYSSYTPALTGTAYNYMLGPSYGQQVKVGNPYRYIGVQSANMPNLGFEETTDLQNHMGMDGELIIKDPTGPFTPSLLVSYLDGSEMLDQNSWNAISRYVGSIEIAAYNIKDVPDLFNKTTEADVRAMVVNSTTGNLNYDTTNYPNSYYTKILSTDAFTVLDQNLIKASGDYFIVAKINTNSKYEYRTDYDIVKFTKGSYVFPQDNYTASIDNSTGIEINQNIVRDPITKNTAQITVPTTYNGQLRVKALTSDGYTYVYSDGFDAGTTQPAIQVLDKDLKLVGTISSTPVHGMVYHAGKVIAATDSGLQEVAGTTLNGTAVTTPTYSICSNGSTLFTGDGSNLTAYTTLYSQKTQVTTTALFGSSKNIVRIQYNKGTLEVVSQDNDIATLFTP